MERVADYVMQKLCALGIVHIFMLTGRGILFLSDAVAREEKMQPVFGFHEQGVSYAAMAYAQAVENPAVCLVSTGCAATNAITACLCAWQDNVPIIFLSGNHMREETTAYTGTAIRTYGSQEADIIAMVRPITKYAVMLEKPEDTEAVLNRAIDTALAGRRGPVWIDIPLDVQNMRVCSEPLAVDEAPMKAQTSEPSKFLRFLQAFSEAERPVLLLGGGTKRNEIRGVVGQLVQKLRIPVVFSPAGADVYGAGNPLSIGSVGSIGGSRAGNFAIQNADFVLAIGTKLCSQLTGDDFSSFARGAKLIVVDIDPIEHTKKEVAHDMLFCMDAESFIRQMLLAELPSVSEQWRQQCTHWKTVFSVAKENFVKAFHQSGQIDLYGFADQLSEFLSEDATVITDAGFEELIIPSTLRLHGAQRLLFPAAQGAMGYAIPAIIGAYFAGRGHLTAIVGDGSIMMNLQELQMVVQYAIPVTIFVINNNMYAVIRKRQRDLFRKRTIGNDPTDGISAPDFRKIAACFGLGYERIDTLEELRHQLPRLLSVHAPLLCEVMSTENQPYLHKSYGINAERRLVKRPLEDLSPFLPRDTLHKEMVIAPLE